MSRAFVKELDGDDADSGVPERPQSEHPNYITAAGLTAMQAKFDAMRERRQQLESQPEELSAKSELQSLKVELSYLEKRLQSAIPVQPGEQDGDAIRFGATVELLDENGDRHAFTIVGEDEADVARGHISWVSPLGRELLNRTTGDAVIWRRPAGDLELEVTGFRYS